MKYDRAVRLYLAAMLAGLVLCGVVGFAQDVPASAPEMMAPQVEADTIPPDIMRDAAEIATWKEGPLPWLGMVASGIVLVMLIRRFAKSAEQWGPLLSWVGWFRTDRGAAILVLVGNVLMALYTTMRAGIFEPMVLLFAAINAATMAGGFVLPKKIARPSDGRT